MGLFHRRGEAPNESSMLLLDTNTNQFFQYRMQFERIVGEKNLYRVETSIEKGQGTEPIDFKKVKKVALPQNGEKDIRTRNTFLLKAKPSIYELSMRPGFAEEIWHLLNAQRIRERLLKSNQDVQKHYLYYRMGQKDGVIAKTDLYVGSIMDSKEGIKRCYTQEDEAFNTQYARREIERIDEQVRRIGREKQWRQVCLQMWDKILEESENYNESMRAMREASRQGQEKPYQPKHAAKEDDEETR